MKKEDQIVNDEGMYDYFHDLLKEKLDGLSFGKEKQRKRENWQMGLTAYNFEQIYETRKAIYSEKEVCNELCMTDDILHIFQTYFCIPGIDRLLVNNYGALENDIFLEYDAKSGAPKKIREHYKHQYRNAYLGSLLLLEYDFLDAMTECILNSDSIVAGYVKAQTERNAGNIRKVLYQAYFIAAMFHDIGYPLDFFMRKAEQIHQYAPFYKIISSHVKTEFIELRAMLAGSLLFQIISEEKIKEKYDRNDHGCLSAVSFLLNFYSAGSIYSLDELERCVVETAALAIFRHTDRPAEKCLIFEEDPLSYMVRLCDDLQEWERFLLVINEKHNYLKCSKCGSTIKADGRRYYCECGEEYEKITDIVNKKVNYINLCNQLVLHYDEQNGRLEIRLEFDHYKQLEILLDDYCAVKKRHEDLNKVKDYLRCQHYLPVIQLEYYLSNNPVKLIEDFLKKNNLSIEELRNKMQKNQNWDETGKKKMQKFLAEVEEYIQDETKQKKDFGGQLESDIFCYGAKAREFVEEYLGQIHSIMKTGCNS